MSWLLGYTFASLVGAVLAVRIVEFLFAPLVGGIGGAVRVGLHMGTWTAITVSVGMRDFTQRVQRFRRVVSDLIAPTKRGD